LNFALTYRKLLIPFAVLILISLACGTPDEPTPVPTVPPPPTEVPAPTLAPPPTAAPLPTIAPLPTQPPAPTEAPVAEAPAYLVEEFDVDGAPNWLFYMLDGETDDVDVYTEDGQIVFEMLAEYAATVFLYDPYTYKDSYLETTVENRGTNDYYFGLVSRYSDDGYYLFLVNPSGFYGIWKWTPSEGYNMLRTGASASVNTGKDTNLIAAETKGPKLTLWVNGKELWDLEDKELKEGQVGIVVVGFEDLPITAEFNYVVIDEP
jgi:hypothetical protein